jgi:hypothetical protein
MTTKINIKALLIFTLLLAILFSQPLSGFAAEDQTMSTRVESLMAGSRWCFAKDNIVGNIDLNQSLLSEIKEIKEGQYNLNSVSGQQLQQIATDIIQPYIDKKLSITVNDKTYPVKVNRIVKNGGIYTIWLSVDRVSFHSPANQVRIDYRLFFGETDNVHINRAYGYLSDATGAELQKVFDFSQPAFRGTFDFNNRVWQVSIKGHGGNL